MIEKKKILGYNNSSKIQKIFNINFLLYLFSFVLMGLEIVLLKYLVDSQFINIFLLLGIKGVIGIFVLLL